MICFFINISLNGEDDKCTSNGTDLIVVLLWYFSLRGPCIS